MSVTQQFSRIVHWHELSASAQQQLLQRPALSDNTAIADTVRTIIQRVRAEGDAALFALTAELDGVECTELRVSAKEFEAAERTLDRAALDAIDTAIRNVRTFHAAQRVADISLDTVPGVRCERIARAIDAVGLYVPAGSAPLPSAAIMLCVPADLAGCPRKVLCTPPRADGHADAAVLVAARRSGVETVYKLGGAQAIAALAYGTQSIAAVDKVFGPGNAWVTAAKTAVANDPAGAAIDLPAGPSEVMVIADADADAGFVAADLLSQAEHGADSQVVLLTTSERVARATRDQLERQLARLDRRAIAGAALEHSRIIVAPAMQTLLEICNRYAPEHLIIQTAEPRALLAQVRNAGSVFLGAWTPEAVGDYCSGTNHVLPTYGHARNCSGLGVEQFMRQMTVQEVSREGLARLEPTVVQLATLEGLGGHAEAVRIRLADDRDEVYR